MKLELLLLTSYSGLKTVEKFKNMFENTKEALLIEIIKCTVCIDPAPLPGSGLFNVVKAMK